MVDETKFEPFEEDKKKYYDWDVPVDTADSTECLPVRSVHCISEF